jgi:hypothetical protein
VGLSQDQIHPSHVTEDISVVYNAICSLYWDQIRPGRPDVFHRVLEVSPGLEADVVAEILDQLVYRTSLVRVGQTACGKLFYVLVEPPSWFTGWVDATDSTYSYSKEVWDTWDHYSLCSVITARGSSTAFRGGRYGFAKSIQAQVFGHFFPVPGSRVTPLLTCHQCISFLESVKLFSLGRLCHFIQQTINRHYLCYENNLLVPICESASATEALASRLATRNGTPQLTSTPSSVDSLDELRVYLCKLVSPCLPFPLSQLKRQLLNEFGVHLEPQKLGFVKLSDVIKAVAPLFEIEYIAPTNAVITQRLSSPPKVCG